MTVWTCATCAIEHPDTAEPPAVCAICADERQWVPEGGQRWTTRDELAAEGYRITVSELEPGLHAVETDHRLGIGQRGLLVRTDAGNLLWEPPGFIDDAGREAVAALGGVAAVASSHPHLTGSSIQWAHAFGAPATVWVAAADAHWVRRPDPAIRLWSDDFEPVPGVRLVRCGGHFPGSAVAHWAAGAHGRGVLLTGDTVTIGADRASVGIMRSYPNFIPMPARVTRRVRDTLLQLEFDRLYSLFHSIPTDARGIVDRSLTRAALWAEDDPATTMDT
ncbi:hydrolase [Herbiconiux sp. KACC 21604]|uniref:hydrolase n=1 Tax=unclassified Herbiconiux TaxID=2618217 RepID=UPI0014922B7D|nr:hydrolase [Herbiconiux sp. SALV-R1]QJU54837.1 hydrolase [Herbiconiux sp. SALV-R1]WPO85956.1 hydrolase [Herbiconiux sp. KACC 21604]